MLEIQRVPTGAWRENCYIVARPSGDALVVDPGAETEEILGRIREKGLRVHAIVSTHGHYDHVGAVAALKERLQVPFLMHSKDLKLLKAANLYRKAFEGREPVAIPDVDRVLDDVSTDLEIGPFRIEIIHTPGHTSGSVCLRVERNIFSGDTLFSRKIGRTDLPGGDSPALASSLRLLSGLPRYLRVYPGHGCETTIGTELDSNQQLRSLLGTVPPPLGGEP